MNLIMWSLIGTIASMNAKQQRQEIKEGNKISNMMLLDQFLSASEEGLTEMAQSMALYARRATAGNVPSPQNNIPVELLLKLQYDSQIANAINGVEGVLDVLREYGIEFKCDIIPNSAADKVFCVHATGFDWKFIQNWLIGGFVLCAVSFLGITVMAKIKEGNLEREQLKSRVNNLEGDLMTHEDYLVGKGLRSEFTQFSDGYLDLPVPASSPYSTLVN